MQFLTLLVASCWLQATCFTAGSGPRRPTVRAATATTIDTENWQLLTPEQQAVLEPLAQDPAQAHVFEKWPPVGTKDEEKRQLAQQLTELNESYPGGLEAYLRKAKTLLQESADGVNPFAEFIASVPEGEILQDCELLMQAERVGLEHASGLCFCLVAGGLGERLGFGGIKLSLETNLAQPQTYLQHYIDYILAIQHVVRKSSQKDDITLPLCIMTSGDTDAATRKLLEANNYFGMSPSQVTIVVQDKVPALRDGSAGLALDGDFAVQTKPHGHGDVHQLLNQNNVVRQWLDAGRTHVVFLQDTNGLAIHGVLPALGVSIERSFGMNSICIPRLAGEAAGAITKLEHQSDPSQSLVINVEYNQLDPLLRSQGAGDVPDETGYSPYPGNANNIVLELESYAKTLEGEDQGVVLEFVNPKYKDASRSEFKKPTRLECMMQDIPKLFRKEVPDTKIGFTNFDRWLTFSPAKNALEAGQESVQAGNTAPGTLSSAESDEYIQHVKKLQNIGCNIEDAPMVPLAGIPVTAGPRVRLAPSVALIQDDLVAKFPNPAQVTISTESSLVLDGHGIVVESLDLKGALVVEAVPEARVTIRGQVENQGWEWKELDETQEYPEEVAIRGYTKVEHETARFIITDPGDYVIENGGLAKQ